MCQLDSERNVMRALSPMVVVVTLLALMVIAPACTMGQARALLMGEQDPDSPEAQERRQSVSVPSEEATAMSDAAFSDLTRQVEDANMSSDKLGVISTAAASNYFRAYQVEQLVGMLDMSGDRVEVVETTAHRILDLENSHMILDALTFAQERSEAEEILQNVAEERDRERARMAEEESERERSRTASAGDSVRDRALRSDTSDTSQTESSGGDSSAYCCLGGAYNECDGARAARACVNYGMCIFDCMMGGGPGCEDDCLDEYPRVEQCRAVPSKNHLCDD